MKKMMFLAGAAAGYVLGTRAGREKYEQLSAAVRDIAAKPAVKDAVSTVQTQASRLYGGTRAAVTEKLDTAPAPGALRAEDPDLVMDANPSPVG